IDLLLIAEANDRRQRDAVAPEPDDRSHRFAREHELLARDEHVPDVSARAPRALGIREPREARLADLGVERARKLLRLFPGVRMRRDVLLGELARLRAQLSMLVGLEQVSR